MWAQFQFVFCSEASYIGVFCIVIVERPLVFGKDFFILLLTHHFYLILITGNCAQKWHWQMWFSFNHVFFANFIHGRGLRAGKFRCWNANLTTNCQNNIGFFLIRFKFILVLLLRTSSRLPCVKQVFISTLCGRMCNCVNFYRATFLQVFIKVWDSPYLKLGDCV